MNLMKIIIGQKNWLSKVPAVKVQLGWFVLKLKVSI